MICSVLSIAEFIIKIESDKTIQLDEGHQPFVIKDSNQLPDLTLTIIDKNHLKADSGTPIFESGNKDQRFFSVFRQKNGYKIDIFNQQEKETVQQTAFTDFAFKNWEIFVTLSKTPNPLQYPLGPLLLYYLTINHPALMIHGSGVSNGQTGKIFTGVSGSGKSTMARLFQEKGYEVINDDRLIIREINGEFVFYNTPMFYADKPKKAKLTSIHQIYHCKHNVTERIKGAKAVSNIMANCIQHAYDKKMIGHHLHFISALSEKVPLYQTGFKPDTSIVDYLQNDI